MSMYTMKSSFLYNTTSTRNLRKNAGARPIRHARIHAVTVAVTGDSLVDSTVGVIVDGVKVAGDAAKVGIGAAQQGIQVLKGAYDAVSPAVKATIETVEPLVQSATEKAAPVVTAGVRVATNAAESVKPGLERAITSTGIDSKVVSGAENAAEQALTATTPLVKNVIHFVTTTSPVVLAEYGLGLIAAYYLLPPTLGIAAGVLRGYAGDVSPAGALDALSTQGNAVLLDIRSLKEKESAGVPNLANAGKLIELEYASIEDRKIRGLLRDVSTLELKITALQIAALKRLSKSSPIYLMDRNGGMAKAVARELAGRGFKNVYVISNGFSGWARDRLGVKPSSTVSRVEVLLPGMRGGTAMGRQLPADTGARTVRQSLPPQPARRALPSSTGR